MRLPSFDVESYSEAGYRYDPSLKKWILLKEKAKSGLDAVGAYVYAEHKSADLLSLSYNLQDGLGERLWFHPMPLPQDLFDHLARGGLLEAFNVGFERLIWNNILRPTFGFPELPEDQLRCAMAAARAFSLPAGLGAVAKVLGVTQKIGDGKRLLDKFSIPRNPTAKDPRLRIRPEDDPEDAAKLYNYNIGDVVSETEVSELLPPLEGVELEYWRMDQRINMRGVCVDQKGLADCAYILALALDEGGKELSAITGGLSVGQVERIKDWVISRGVPMSGVNAPEVARVLKLDIPPDVRRALEIRECLGSASVKKVDAMQRIIARDGRMHDLFAFCGADRTGRWAGRGPQPQNLPNHGPDVDRCEGCRRFVRARRTPKPPCPHCGCTRFTEASWDVEAVDYALALMATKDLRLVATLGDPIAVISGCLRGMFVAEEGKELICSDYSAIEAVGLAILAGEEWRLDVFRTHGKIYEASASKITGIPFEEFLRHKKETGEHHPMRKKIGKPAELASGYGGGIAAWKIFGADKFLSDDEIETSIRAWRKASPMVCALWYGLGDAATNAIKYNGNSYSYRDITYFMVGSVLNCLLPSGRCLHYHNARLVASHTKYGRATTQILYDGWNTDSSKPPTGWVTLRTWGGKLAENVNQAVCRDIMAHGMLNLDRKGYLPVLHIHDEPVAEVPLGFGSIEEFEACMCDLPHWAKHWPLRAGGGWRGRRYRKD